VDADVDTLHGEIVECVGGDVLVDSDMDILHGKINC
jgi:hypothetical protein